MIIVVTVCAVAGSYACIRHYLKKEKEKTVGTWRPFRGEEWTIEADCRWGRRVAKSGPYRFLPS